MIVKVGGCYGSVSPGYHTVGFLLNGSLLLEGGTVTSTLAIDEQNSITDILISHIHLDHTKELFFLLDNLVSQNCCTVTFHGVKEVVDGVRQYLFNEQLWPDFSRLPSTREPILRFHIVPAKKFSRVGEFEVKPVMVNHPVPTSGYIIREKKGAILYTGDTGPTREIWETARDEKDLRAIVAETSFPNDMEELAINSGHLTPSLLAKELDLLGRPEIPVYVFHMKPLYLVKIREELAHLKGYRIEIFQQGKSYEF